MKRWVALAAVLGLTAALSGCSKKKPEKARPSLEADQTRPAQSWLSEEPVRLLYDYVRIDTTSETKGEKEGAEFLKAFFDCAGIENEIVCPSPGRCNLLARLPGRRREGALLLLNHIDVVPAYAGFWKDAQPFEGKIRNGYLYGRGSYDMKSIAIAQALAMRRLKDRGIVPESDVLFLGEADEEYEQLWGSRWLLEHRPDSFADVGYVLNEGGTDEMVIRDVRYWGIETIQNGFALAELEAKTKTPIEALESRWSRIDAPAVEPHPHVVMGFDMLANHLVSPLTDPLRHLDRVRRDRAQLERLPDRYATFLQARLRWLGPYPFPPDRADHFRAFVAVSVPPGVDPDAYLAPVVKEAAGSTTLIRAVSSGTSGASPYPTPFTDLLRRVTEAYSPGIPFGPMPGYGGFTTSVLFRRKGFPTYGYSPIAMNITDSVRRHGNDERIFLRDYLTGCALYADIVEEFALFPPAKEMSSGRAQSDNK